MTARKQTVSVTEPTLDHARTAVLAAEVARRLALPIDRWDPVTEPSDLTAEARTRLAALRRARAGTHE